jgi:uncharacterized protein (TIGR01777 family)
MKIVIAGGSGFLGEPLVAQLLGRGDDVAVLSRNPAHVRAGRALQWDGRTQGPWSSEVALADVVINLAGENIGEGRWTEERKKRLIGSRLDATAAIVEALQREASRQRVMINASAVGYYGDRGDELLSERSERGEGFLAKLVEQWEVSARRAEPLARLVVLRFGVVLAVDGGALKKMMLPFRFGLGGPIGSGEQWMSWVTREDALRMVQWAVDGGEVRGVYNVVSPQPVRNRELTRALGKALHRPAILPAPAFALRMAFGQMADEALLASQRVIPERGESEGFWFEDRSIDRALARAVGGC